MNEENKPEPEDEEPFIIARFKAFDTPFPLPLPEEEPPDIRFFGRPLHAMLNEAHEVVPCRSLRKWGEFMARSEKRRVAERTINGFWVSTVFLGIDHGFGLGPSSWFETMVFEDKELPPPPEIGPKIHRLLSEMQLRYETWVEAEKGHEMVVEMIRTGLF
jgi:hypothetical protein